MPTATHTPQGETGHHARPRRRKTAPLNPTPSALRERIDHLEQRLAGLERLLSSGDLAERVALQASQPLMRALDARIRSAERDLREAVRREAQDALAGKSSDPRGERDVDRALRKLTEFEKNHRNPSAAWVTALLNSPDFKRQFDQRIRGVLDYLRERETSS